MDLRDVGRLPPLAQEIVTHDRMLRAAKREDFVDLAYIRDLKARGEDLRRAAWDRWAKGEGATRT